MIGGLGVVGTFFPLRKSGFFSKRSRLLVSVRAEMTSDECHNSQAWDDLAREGASFANPVRPVDFQNPGRIINPFGWLPTPYEGRRVLCLAAGGGRHGPLFAAAGAVTTVVDISEEMLKLDRWVAERESLTLTTLKTSMSALEELGTAVFDIVLQPVSSCYVSDLNQVYREVARVLKPGGVYVVQHKQPISLQASSVPDREGRYVICEPYDREGALPPVTGSEHREPGTHEYLHRLENILGGLCRAGFVIDDVREPRHGDPEADPGSFRHRSRYVPPYLAVRAIRSPEMVPLPESLIWTPPSS